MTLAIEVSGISKEYRLGVIGYGTLREDLHAWWAKIRGKEDPFTRVGRPVWNKLQSQVEGSHFWALNNVSFSVDRGDVVGVIGKNGSGKSTLLKILSRVTSPTKGCARIKGRLTSLLEVGTGFQPELTGRENIFLNGAILGMSKKEIRTKLDEIIDFSGTEIFIDTPVKRYSSGMYLRLAFAVAAHLDSEILLIDEVLAVGDAEFQKRCLGKMESISHSGRTILFVSHNLNAVKSICSHGIVLSQGELVFSGSSADAVELYSGSDSEKRTEWIWNRDSNRPENEFIALCSAKLIPLRGDRINVYSGIEFEFSFLNKVGRMGLDVCVHCLTGENLTLFETRILLHQRKDSKKGLYIVKCVFPENFLNVGNYIINLIFRESQWHVFLKVNDMITFHVNDPETIGSYDFRPPPGILAPLINWSCQFEEMNPSNMTS